LSTSHAGKSGRALRAVLVYSTVICFGSVSNHNVSAHDYAWPGPYRVSHQHDIRVTSPYWVSEVDATVDDYDSVQQLSMHWGEFSFNSTPIRIVMGNYCQLGGLFGRADPMTFAHNKYRRCWGFPDGLNTYWCGHIGDTEYKIRYAHIYLNTCAPGWEYWLTAVGWKRMLVTHEVGHVLGLKHVPCSTRSIMCEMYDTSVTSLQTHDRSDLEDKYYP
jgi:hypothetical protein